MTVLSLDPSGNFDEGKGVTGWALFKNKKLIQTGIIEAGKYDTAQMYYEAHVNLIRRTYDRCDLPFVVVIEDYRLYSGKAAAQIGSRMETCQLLGVLKYVCNTLHINYHMQAAAEVKKRWADEILMHEEIKLPTGYMARHQKDAIRHGVHFITFHSKENKYVTH